MNQLPENNKNPIAESNNDYDISMDIETRIAELRTCPVLEDHVRMLEDLLQKTTLKLQKAEAEVERLRNEFLKSIVRDELQKKIIIKQHEILCEHGLAEYGN